MRRRVRQSQPKAERTPDHVIIISVSLGADLIQIGLLRVATARGRGGGNI